MSQSFDQVAQGCRIEGAELSVWIERRWVRPRREGESFAFAEIDVARVELIRDLRRDLGIAEEAVPMLLSLIDQVHGLRADLASLLEAVEAQPEPVREAILAHVKRRP